MHIFGGGVFLVACRSECPISTLKGGGNARQFVVGCLPTAMPDFKPLKQGEMLVNFFVGVFWFLFGSKMDLSGSKWTFPAPKSIEFGAGSVNFGV
jgi:hypothetical protein